MTAQLSDALEMVALSDTGLLRSHNEDAIVIDRDHGIALLADGMGGYQAGEVASHIAVSMVSEGLRSSLGVIPAHVRELGTGRPHIHRLLLNEINRANLAIFETAQSQPQCHGMGTTLVSAVFYDNRVAIAHAGDSRMYRLRNGEFTAITRDHSLLQEQLDAGMITPEQARLAEHRNLVTRAVGVDPAMEAELNDFAVLPGDLYLMCSDGLNDMVDDTRIHLTLGLLASNLQQAADELIQMANQAGGRDNVSIILIKVVRDFSATKGFWSRLFSWL
ncbi:Stp1/IreP family PP2C-type Ser/Thr phosphatase [Burkholderiaceae bacterium DAT-1]|nr:Stp1/IreP family PP2C-type Ser/Thr phosphatase [Burkholderiaceae bacterium DAT-1]